MIKAYRIKKLILILAAVLAIASPIQAYAEQAAATLSSISFTNSEIDGGFSPQKTSYTLTLYDKSITPSLESYDIDGDGELLVTYSYDEKGTQVGIIATLKYENGSIIYTFLYANTPEVPNGSDNYLSDIYCSLGEIQPSVNDEDSEYTLYIPSDLTELAITPVTRDTNASCADIELTLDEGQETSILLVCTASDGSTREYTLNITRVDKTCDEVRAEMAQEDYVSFVEKEKVTSRPELYVLIICAAAGLAVLMLIRHFAIRVTAVTKDENEKPFYRE